MFVRLVFVLPVVFCARPHLQSEFLDEIGKTGESSDSPPQHEAKTRREAALAEDGKQEVKAKMERYSVAAKDGSVEKGAKLERGGKREVLKKNGEEKTTEEVLEENEAKKEGVAKTEREAKQADKTYAERNAKAQTEADAFKDAATAFGDGSEAAAKQREKLRQLAKAERAAKAAVEADRKKAAAEAKEKAEAEEEAAGKAADKARAASLAAKVEHIKKMRVEHKKKAEHEVDVLDKSSKAEADKERKEKVDIWGSKDGAAGAAVRKTVDVGLDEKAAAAKAEEEEKECHSFKNRIIITNKTRKSSNPTFPLTNLNAISTIHQMNARQ